MLALDKIQHLAETYAPQELFAALVWQRQFNLFDGSQVITDLANHPDLWESFLFTKPGFAPDKEDGLWGKQADQDCDAIVGSYWWD